MKQALLGLGSMNLVCRAAPVHQAAIGLHREHFPKLLKLQRLGHLALPVVVAEHHEVVRPARGVPVRVVVPHMCYRVPHQIRCPLHNTQLFLTCALL